MSLDSHLKVLRSISFALFLNFCSGQLTEPYKEIPEEFLLETYRRVKDDLAFYIIKEEEKLSDLKRYLNLYKKEHDKAMEDISNYVGNPINAFKLIKRLTIDLEHLRKNVKMETEYMKNVTMKHKGLKYPEKEDVTKTAQVIIRLQKMYNLKVKELAEGKLKGNTSYSIPMTAGDCYALGQVLHKDSDYEYARAWMVEAFRKHNQENMEYLFTEVDIMEYISIDSYKMGDIKTALHWTLKILDLDPEHVQAREMVSYYRKIIATGNKVEQKRKEVIVQS